MILFNYFHPYPKPASVMAKSEADRDVFFRAKLSDFGDWRKSRVEQIGSYHSALMDDIISDVYPSAPGIALDLLSILVKIVEERTQRLRS